MWKALLLQGVYFTLPVIDDLFDVKHELREVADKWESIGEALRLSPDLLEKIAANNKDEKRRLKTVLTEWLNQSYNVSRFGPPSWNLLVEAVAHPDGGDNRALAEKIAQKSSIWNCLTMYVSLLFV